MPPLTPRLRRALCGTAGITLGGLSALVEMVAVVFLAIAHAVPAARRGVERAGQAFVGFERRRLVAFLGVDDHAFVPPDWRRAQAYLARRVFVGLTGAVIMVLIAVGLLSGVIMAKQVAVGRPMGGGDDAKGDTLSEILAIGIVGVILLFVAVWGLIGVVHLERSLADRFLGPTEEELLRRRVIELATTRNQVVAAVNDERRRIERDLHDGVQQRLVALGLLLGRARRATDPSRAEELLAQAHEESQQALRDLRDVTWRVYPAALDAGGLRTALEGVAERASVPVRFRYELDGRLDLATETVAYFVASEAVTNALKHGHPTAIDLEVTATPDGIEVTVRDDGRGGADVKGSGLTGLASRVAAADGVFIVDSPVGGPTVVSARLPVLVPV